MTYKNKGSEGRGLWIKARGLGQGWTRPAGRAPGRLVFIISEDLDLIAKFPLDFGFN